MRLFQFGEAKFGLRGHESYQKMNGTKAFTNGLNVAGWMLCLWCAIWPKPYVLAIGLAVTLPWLVLFWVGISNRQITLFKKKGETHPSLDIAFTGPGLGVGIRALSDFHILDWQMTLGLSVGVAIVLIIVGWCVRPQHMKRWVIALGLIFIGAYYSFGTIVEINAITDRAPLQTYQVMVTDKTIDHGRSTYYNFSVAAWPLKDASENVHVSEALFDATPKGGVVCLSVHTGMLGIRWFDVLSCSNSSQAE